MPHSFLNDLFTPSTSVAEVRRTVRRMAQRHERSVKDMKERVRDLEDWLGEVTLLNQAMIRLLLTKKTIGREEMARAVHAVDVLDGVADGKVTRKPRKKAAKKRAKKKAAKRKKG